MNRVPPLNYRYGHLTEESEGWSVSQKEAIREELTQLCIDVIELHEEVAQSDKATTIEIEACLERLEAITKGEQ